MEQRVSLVTLGVKNVPASRGFYERLGWKASGVGGDQVAFFQAGGMALSVYGWADLAEDAGFPRSRPPTPATEFTGVALAHNVRTRADVAIVLAEAAQAGGKILKPAQDAFWGGHHGYFADPDGHVWEVAWNPGFPLKDDGSLALPT